MNDRTKAQEEVEKLGAYMRVVRPGVALSPEVLQRLRTQYGVMVLTMQDEPWWVESVVPEDEKK